MSAPWCVRLLRAEGTNEGGIVFNGTRDECDQYVREHPLAWPESFHRSLEVEPYEEEDEA